MNQIDRGTGPANNLAMVLRLIARLAPEERPVTLTTRRDAVQVHDAPPRVLREIVDTFEQVSADSEGVHIPGVWPASPPTLAEQAIDRGDGETYREAAQFISKG